MFLHVDLVQTVHDVLFVVIGLFDAFRAVQGAAIRIFCSVILCHSLSTLPLGILDFNSIEDLLFYDLKNSRDNRCLEFVRVNFGLLNMLSSQDQFESVFDLGLCAAFYDVGDLAPLVAELEPLFEELLVLAERPLTLLDGRVKRCQPSLSALLPVTGREHQLISVFVRSSVNELYQSIVQFF